MRSASYRRVGHKIGTRPPGSPKFEEKTMGLIEEGGDAMRGFQGVTVLLLESKLVCEEHLSWIAGRSKDSCHELFGVNSLQVNHSGRRSVAYQRHKLPGMDRAVSSRHELFQVYAIYVALGEQFWIMTAE
ncbi:hypothetical protein F511_14125 [Dorcoceras hygrometricum]|uniref:Uncharacterized protein n=1 Tax=Dorcoceras hygrometricum TaxID=472368 RepID=A0A2Z7DAR2_9LAMI|nr:hypothetical protein F511_14125 [Dorcoceras hygrometricum]